MSSRNNSNRFPLYVIKAKLVVTATQCSRNNKDTNNEYISFKENS